MSNAARPRPSPTRGRPRGLSICSVIVPTPDAVLQLHDTSARQVMAAAGQEAAYKAIERVSERQQPGPLPKSLAQLFADLAQRKGSASYIDLLSRSASGDEQARRVVSRLPMLEGCSQGLHGMDGEVPPAAAIMVDHFLEVERSIGPVQELLSQQAFAAAADAWREIPTVQHYLGEIALLLLKVVPDHSHLRTIQMAGMCELLLSQLARVDVRLPEYGATPGNFSTLLRLDRPGGCRPGREFMRWLLKALDIPTPERLCAYASEQSCAEDDDLPDETTVKAWYVGRNIPPARRLERLLDAVTKRQACHDEVQALRKTARLRLEAARRFSKLLLLVAPPPQRNTTGLVPLLMPLEGRVLQRTPQEWITSRFAFWHNHWSRTPAPLPGSCLTTAS